MPWRAWLAVALHWEAHCLQPAETCFQPAHSGWKGEKEASKAPASMAAFLLQGLWRDCSAQHRRAPFPIPQLLVSLGGSPPAVMCQPALCSVFFCFFFLTFFSLIITDLVCPSSVVGFSTFYFFSLMGKKEHYMGSSSKSSEHAITFQSQPLTVVVFGKGPLLALHGAQSPGKHLCAKHRR